MRAISPMRNMANDEEEGRNESNGANGKKCSQKQAKTIAIQAVCHARQERPVLTKDGERYKSTILQLFRLTFIVMGPSCIPLDQWLVSIGLQQESFPLPGTYYALSVSRVNFTGNLLIFHIIIGNIPPSRNMPTILNYY